MEYGRIYQVSNTCVFVLVESVCTALILAPKVSFMVQFSVVAWRLHRDGIIMVSCSAFYGVYMMSVVSVMFFYPSRNAGGPHRNCTLYTRVIRVPSAFPGKL